MSDIQEGFICPICHKDMKSPNGLIGHFQELHSDEQEFLKSLKDLYGKAKKKILKLDDEQIQDFKALTMETYEIQNYEPQEPGPSTSHTYYFKTVRRERLDHRTAETNKLIIRLDRLLRTYGTDKKQQEQELVVWLDGTTVTRCPSCTQPFNIARRQHHCRLCGCIMCKSCSYFLPQETAQTIVAPVNSTRDNEYSKKDSIRICLHCLNMLENRRKAQMEQVMKPTLWHLYNMLQTNKKQTQTSVDLYNKMYNSLTSGETTFLLQDANSLRTSIAEKAQIIDTLSKKIANEPVNPAYPKAAILQKNIQKSTSNYIKDCLLTLPAPPSVEELEKIRGLSSIFSIDNAADHKRTPTAVQKVAVTTGWSPSTVPNKIKEQEDNPLVEQMNIVRNYIAQARQAHRYEEVVSLEENLRMLKEMYRQQQKLQTNSNS